jgi:hypothetical protein
MITVGGGICGGTDDMKMYWGGEKTVEKTLPALGFEPGTVEMQSNALSFRLRCLLKFC